MREEARIDEVINGVADKYGRLDIVVNNSGINMLASLYEMPTETWRQVLDVSLTGPFMVTRRALNVMRDRGTRGAIVNMSSIAGWMRTGEGESHYAAAKAGITGFTRAAAMEAAPHGIRVNAVAPGLAWNPFLGKIYGDELRRGDGPADATGPGGPAPGRRQRRRVPRERPGEFHHRRDPVRVRWLLPAHLTGG